MSERTRCVLLASCVTAVFLLLRLSYFEHLLLWDEGRFLATLDAFSSCDRASPFWFYGSFHPPLYLLACLPLRRLSSSAGTVRALCQALSLLASLGTLGLVYLIGRDLEGRRTGLLAALAYALFPAGAALNVWIKEDPLCMLLSLASLYLYLRRMPWGSGALLGLALLTKEIAVATALTLGLFALLTATAGDWRARAAELAKACGTAAAVAGWWYLFVSSSVGYFARFYAGSTYESRAFHQPWHYYLTGLWTDLGGLLALCALGGTLVMAAGCRARGGRASLLPLAWSAASFLPLFFSYGKPYWMISMALPALALTSAVGLGAAFDLLKKRSSTGLAGFALAAVVLSSLVAVLFPGHAGYVLSKRRYVPLGVTDHSYSAISRETARYFAAGWSEGDRLLGAFETSGMPNPVFLYYLDRLGGVLALEGNAGLALQTASVRPAWTFIAETPQCGALRQEMSRHFSIEPLRVGFGYAYPTYLLFPELQR